MTTTEAARIVEAADTTKTGYINTSTLVIGVTGSGKSTLFATAAEYLYEKYSAVSAYYFSDLGGYPDRMNALIRLGIVWVFRMRTRGMHLSFETAQLSSMGWWPATIRNPLTGEVPTGVQMVSPIQVQWFQTCECGHTRAVAHKTLLDKGACPACQRRIILAATKVRQEQRLTPGLDRIRMRMYDGATSLSEWYLQDLSKRPELGGEMGAIGGVVESGGLTFRGNNRAHVGFAQTRAHELISNSLSIPNQIIMPIWSALSNESTDGSGRLSIIGPKLAGDAKTETAPAWFGNTLEAAVVEGSRPGEKIRRLYLNEFVDDQGRRHILKHRGSPRYMPEHLDDAPYSAEEPPREICTQFSLGTFFRLLEEADAKALEEATERFPEAPGIGSVPTSFLSDTPEEEATPADVESSSTTSRPRTIGRPAPARPRSARPKAAPQDAPAAPTPDAPTPDASLEAVATAAPPTVPAAPTPEPPPIAAPAAPAPEPMRAAVPPAPSKPGWAPPPGARPARPLPQPRKPVAPPTSAPQG